MGGGGSKASGGGGSGSSSSSSEYGGRCITRIIEPSRKDSSKTVVKDSHSYPSAHSNSRSGEGSKSTGAKKKKARLVDYLTAVLLNILAVIPVLFSAPYLQEKVIFLILMHRSILNPLNLIYCKNMEVLLL